MNWWIIVLLAIWTVCASYADYNSEDTARRFINKVNQIVLRLKNYHALASYNYDTNITDTNLQRKLQASKFVAEREKLMWKKIIRFNWRQFKDPWLKRQFKFYSVLGSAILPPKKLERMEVIRSQMKKLYSTAKICIDQNNEDCGYVLDPDLVKRLANSRNPELLKTIWVNWRNAIGPKVRDLYAEYIDLSNEAAHLNNFTDVSEHWLNNFEDPDFKNSLTKIWKQLKPLYLQIHAYVRYHLRKQYGNIVSEEGPIPAHLLGNMWAQSWSALSDFTLPYPDQKSPNLNKELVEKSYGPISIFKKAEEFYTSINFTAMPPSFWKLSLLEKPKDRDVVCHASAYDLYLNDDVRIKQCTQVTFGHFRTAHHEMGHIEYYLQYKHLPVKFRRGANSGFHEAVGDTIALSVTSRKHLRKLGFLAGPDDERSLLNSLFVTGLDKIVFLPYGYLMDLWRWDVQSGKTKPENYNCEWWKLREEYQGVEPPVDRTEDDFDPAAKYHIVSDVPFIRYFVSFILQFQFHRALCTIAGEYDPEDPSKPLHNCDIYENKDAGNAFKEMLSLGCSRPWQDVLETLTSQRELDASALLEYFKPLHMWLKEENQKNGAFVGWHKSNKGCAG